MPCNAACRKIIIDTGRVARAAKFYAKTAKAHLREYEKVREELSAEETDRLHAESEVNCHRAALIIEWAEELHRQTVRMSGGEYYGRFDVDGVEAPRLKE